MNQRAAFDETVALAIEKGMHPWVSSGQESLGLNHLLSMQTKINEGTFSEPKLGRWLGWAQAALVAANVGVSLEDVKAINLRHEPDVDPRAASLAATKDSLARAIYNDRDGDLESAELLNQSIHSLTEKGDANEALMLAVDKHMDGSITDLALVEAAERWRHADKTIVTPKHDESWPSGNQLAEIYEEGTRKPGVINPLVAGLWAVWRAAVSYTRSRDLP